MATFERSNRGFCAGGWDCGWRAMSVAGQAETQQPRARRGAIPTCRECGRSPRSLHSSGPRRSQDKGQLTEQEAAAAEKTFLKTQNQDRRDGAGTDADVALAYNDFWWDRGTKVVSTRQTSLVVDPPDGRVPALTSEGQQRAAARATRGYDSWEDRSLWERCITRGLPMIPGPYNNNYQILQTPTHVVILHEMIHDARIVPLDGRPHVGAEHPAVVWRFAWPMGRRHARRRDNEFHR